MSTKLPKAKEQGNAAEYLDRIGKFVNNGKELLAIFINVITAIILFTSNPARDHSSSFTIVVEVLNVTILLIAIIMLSRRYHLIVTPSEQVLLADLEVEDDAQKLSAVRSNVDRINVAVSQFTSAHKGFALFLLFLYILLFISDSAGIKQSDDEFKALARSDSTLRMKIMMLPDDSVSYVSSMSNQVQERYTRVVHSVDSGNISSCLESATRFGTAIRMFDQSVSNLIAMQPIEKRKNYIKILDSIHRREDTLMVTSDTRYIFAHNYSLVSLLTKPTEGYQDAAISIVFLMIDNLFNILSGTFLFIAFSVLYTNTIEDDNKTSRINYWLPFSVAGGFFFFITLSCLVGFHHLPLNVLAIVARIISGSFNGAGMALLFSRFISMEYFYKESDIWTRYFYYVGTVVILPTYAVVQPLYGLFDTDVLGTTHFLKDIVLLLCLWGKVFFFLLVYKMLANNWIHAYILTLRFSEERIKSISGKIQDITNIKTKKQQS